jgi:uncharacterized membrane protein
MQAKFAAFLIVLVCVAGCGHDDHDHHGHDDGEPSGAICAEGSALTYENFGNAFLTTYCARCHAASVKGPARQGAPADHIFDTVDQVRAFAVEIDKGAAVGPSASNNGMPVGTPTPTNEERLRLGEWLACGAP